MAKYKKVIKKKKEKAIKPDINNIILRITSCFTFGFSVAACTGFNTHNCIISAAIYALLNTGYKGISPIIYYMIFLVSNYLLNISGLALSVVSFIAATIISVLICSKCAIKTDKKSPEIGGLMLSTGLSVTCLMTTHYFGIGAEGNTFVEMIKNYVSLGFHPNWRGILFGTIVMVIMITFPRKFKKFSKHFKASFIALFVTLIFNLFMLPKSGPEFYSLCHYTTYIYPSIYDLEFIKNLYSALSTILCTAALSIILISAKSENTKRDLLPLIQSATTFTPAMPSNVNITLSDWFNGAVAALIILSTLFCSSLLERIPVASCAVVLIVGAWQSVDWSYVATGFKSLKGFAILTAIFIASTITPPFTGVILAAVISLLMKKITFNFKPERSNPIENQ